MLWIMAAFVFMGGMIEILQGLSGYRDAEWLDWAADCAGVLAGCWWPARRLAWMHRRLTQYPA